MRYSIPAKFIAIVLAAVSLVAVFGSCFGIVQVAELGLYTNGIDDWVTNRMQWQALDLAEDLVDRYAVRKLTNCPDEVLEELGYWYLFEESVHWTGLDQKSYDFVITDPNGETLAASEKLPQEAQRFAYQTLCSVQFPVMVTDKAEIEKIYGTEYVHQKVIHPEVYNGKAVTIRYYASPEYQANVILDMDDAMARSGASLELLQMIYNHRYNLMVLMALSLILLGAMLVYLSVAAGKAAAKGKAAAAGLNRLPLDIYAGMGALAGWLLGRLALQLINYWIYQVDKLNAGTLVIVGMVLLGIALLIVGFYFALCAQIKTGSVYWLKNLFLTWLGKKIWLALGYCAKGMRALLALLPVIWRHLLIGGVIGVGVAVATVFACQGIIVPLLVVSVLFVLVVLYSGYAYAVLLQGAERMANGDLSSQIDTRLLVGYYRRCAQQLNALADVAIDAAQKQLRSERMRSELITNVSHDIKTPLTSIINYVDLLQSAKKAEEAEQYLEVLSRQSLRLKKLIDDLMEMSRASAGSIAVHPVSLDPVETVNQALGEFADKLAGKDLQMVFNRPEQAENMLADGRLAWRVLSNLLSNIVKYAMPGTRVYADVTVLEEHVLISLKNISAQPLNVSADELTERFVRGDISRNTEGSGLGLNIAKSLMELQKGRLQLMVDGDLFKATLVFPKA